MVFELRKINEILELNPTTKLAKGTIAKKVAMGHITENQKYINKFDVTEFKGGSKFKNNDVLVARITPCLENGKTAFVDILEEGEIAFGSTEYFVIRNIPNITDSHYLYYLMRTPIIRDTLIKSMTGTSGRQRAQKESLLDFQFSIPSLQEQTKIAKTLSNIDDKIRLNQQIIANLEELSRTLFKRWFVDFEFPDKEGNPYKSSKGEFISSSQGLIPRASSIGTIDQIGSIIGGGTPLKKIAEYYTTSGISWITPKDLSIDKSIFIYNGQIDITNLGLEKSSAKLMPEESILFSSRAPIGYIAITGKPVATNQGFKSIVPNKGLGPYYIYFLLKQMLPAIKQSAGGSTFKEISGKGLKNIEIIIPNKNIVDKFNEIVKVYFDKIKSLELEVQLIENLRDTLLPKLMSGEIELPNDLEVDEHAELLQ